MHAVVLVCWVGFLIGNSVFTTRICLFGVIPAFSVFLSVIPAFLCVQRAPSGVSDIGGPIPDTRGALFAMG